MTPLPKEITSKITAEAQHRYGDKTTNEHHEQACYIAGATLWAQRAIGFSLWLIDADHYRVGSNEWQPYPKQGQKQGAKVTTEQLFIEYLKTLPQ